MKKGISYKLRVNEIPHGAITSYFLAVHRDVNDTIPSHASNDQRAVSEVTATIQHLTSSSPENPIQFACTHNRTTFKLIPTLVFPAFSTFQKPSIPSPLTWNNKHKKKN